LTCPYGHHWEHVPDPPPADLAALCPVCTATRERTAHQAEADPGSGQEPAPLRVGQVLAGFEILQELDRGGMGIIYKARQQGLNRLVALKVISPDRLDNTAARDRFRREPCPCRHRLRSPPPLPRDRPRRKRSRPTPAAWRRWL
jgi:hypothetical protein